MANFVTIFISGICGVFCSMLLLYCSIRITANVTDRILAAKEERK
ncbi:MAG: hypothetical protein U9N77_10355 [Thermodesulfobacteriota bacterium]|nr:hypothetical protein [Thermodesulfobacteriota bacterium]